MTKLNDILLEYGSACSIHNYMSDEAQVYLASALAAIKWQVLGLIGEDEHWPLCGRDSACTCTGGNNCNAFRAELRGKVPTL